MVDDLRPRHVEHELLPALGAWAARDADGPVRVRLVQLAALADHLGLDPQTESDPERLDLRRNTVEAAGQLPPVDEPVAERRVVRIALAEPAVVEDEQLDTEVARGRGDLDELRLIEAEVGCLPVVEEDRPRPASPAPARQPVAIEPVKRIAHRPEPGRRMDEDRLGRLE